MRSSQERQSLECSGCEGYEVQPRRIEAVEGASARPKSGFSHGETGQLVPRLLAACQKREDL